MIIVGIPLDVTSTGSKFSGTKHSGWSPTKCNMKVSKVSGCELIPVFLANWAETVRNIDKCMVKVSRKSNDYYVNCYSG